MTRISTSARARPAAPAKKLRRSGVLGAFDAAKSMIGPLRPAVRKTMLRGGGTTCSSHRGPMRRTPSSAVQELYHSNGWTDGLPIVPPTADAVQACLDWAMMPPDQLIGIEPVRGLADHRREARHQRGDGGLPADAFPGRDHRLDGDDAGGVPDARRHRQHRRLRRAGGAERPDPARARRQRHASMRWATAIAPPP